VTGVLTVPVPDHELAHGEFGGVLPDARGGSRGHWRGQGGPCCERRPYDDVRRKVPGSAGGAAGFPADADAVGPRAGARATLHLHTAEDYASLRPALQPVLSAGLRALGARADGWDPEPVLDAAHELLADQPRTFAALRAALAERFLEVDERALGFTVRMRLPVLMVPFTP